MVVKPAVTSCSSVSDSMGRGLLPHALKIWLTIARIRTRVRATVPAEMCRFSMLISFQLVDMFQIINAVICDFDLLFNDGDFFSKGIVLADFPCQLLNFHVGDGLRFAVSNQDTRKGHNSRYKGGNNCVHGIAPLIHIQAKLCVVVVGNCHVHVKQDGFALRVNHLLCGGNADVTLLNPAMVVHVCDFFFAHLFGIFVPDIVGLCFCVGRAFGRSVRLASGRLVFVPVGLRVRCAGGGRGRIGYSGGRSSKICGFFMLPVFGAFKCFLCNGVRLVVGLVVRRVFRGNIAGHSLVKLFCAFCGFFVRASNVRFIFGRGGAGIISHRLSFGLRMPSACGFVVQLCAAGLVIVSGRHLSHGLAALAAIDCGSVLRGVAVSGTDIGRSFLHVCIPDGIVFQLCSAIELFPDGHALLHPILDCIHHPIRVRPVKGCETVLPHNNVNGKVSIHANGHFEITKQSLRDIAQELARAVDGITVLVRAVLVRHAPPVHWHLLHPLLSALAVR
nr:MAG TPA: hypothetical protein [Caudoviricetes sp.]